MDLYLKPLRRKAGMTQQEVADALGVSRQHYVGIENNQVDSVSKSHMNVFCEIFKCSPGDLFADDGKAKLAEEVTIAIEAVEERLEWVKARLGM